MVLIKDVFPCKNILIEGIKFILHFLLVMFLLSCGAMVLAYLEDPAVMYRDSTGQNATSGVKSTNTTEKPKTNQAKTRQNLDDKMEQFWKSLETKYNFSISDQLRGHLWTDIKRHINVKVTKKKKADHSHSTNKAHKDTAHHSKKFIFMKWFYFAIIATTTIGYGHVYPTTDNGKLFYIFFSIIGIVLMMMLLRSCGKILMAANQELHLLVTRWFFAKSDYGRGMHRDNGKRKIARYCPTENGNRRSFNARFGLTNGRNRLRMRKGNFLTNNETDLTSKKGRKIGNVHPPNHPHYVSKELLSVISLGCLFLVFMCLVVWHDMSIGEVNKWSWIDTYYFWLVTFTTVGFGDIHFPLEVEIQHFYELVVCRVVGLSFLAAIIESIHDYIKYRRVKLIKGNEERLKRFQTMVVGEEIEPLADMLKREYRQPGELNDQYSY